MTAQPTVQQLLQQVQQLQRQVAALSTTAQNSQSGGLSWPFSSMIQKQIRALQYVQPVIINYTSTIIPDASSGKLISITLTGNLTLSSPINAVDGQTNIWEFIQDGTGSRTLTLGSAFAFGVGISSATLTTTAGARDFMGTIYKQSTGKFYVVAFANGY